MADIPILEPQARCWTITVQGADDQVDSVIEETDPSLVARAVAVAMLLSNASRIEIVRPDKGVQPMDLIESGNEAALAQWQARWAAVRGTLESPGATGYLKAMNRIEERIPVGLPVGERWLPKMAGRVTFQLAPERTKRLIEVLQSAGAHPSGLGSYEAANDANALAEDIRLMAEGQEGF